jgi:Domain of unknown function (DUF5666)
MAERFLPRSYSSLRPLLAAACTLRHMQTRKLISGVGAIAAAFVLTGVASAASPVTGSISGPVTSVKGSTFTMTTSLSPTGKATVTVGKSATIVTQATVALSSLKTGDCVMATGAKSTKGVVTAQRISLSTAVKGTCTAGFGRRGGAGGRPPGAGTGTGKRPTTGGGAGGFNFANFGFAFGSVSSIKGNTLTVKGTFGGKATTTTVDVSSKTTISKTVDVAPSAIAVKDCVFVNGSSTDKGVTVTATNINLTKPTSTGCRFGFAGR